MKKTAKLASERLKNVILSDKVSHPDRLNDLLKSDVTDMLKNLFRAVSRKYKSVSETVGIRAGYF
ncbi:MAG: hypothetical protein L6V85_10580 [Clostridiales bacterium]|nr:MAG: hypothetical protein L6V85_10580 [Clostridiales bacterium]